MSPLTWIKLIPKSTHSAACGRKSNQIDEMDLYLVLVSEVYVTGTVVLIILSSIYNSKFPKLETYFKPGTFSVCRKRERERTKMRVSEVGH